MKVNTLRIPVLELTQSAEHYQLILQQAPAFGSADLGYIGFELENVTLLLESAEPGEFEAGRYLGFSLEVEDIHYFYQGAIDRGVEFTGAPVDQPWGGIMTHIKDCNGNVFSLVQSGR